MTVCIVQSCLKQPVSFARRCYRFTSKMASYAEEAAKAKVNSVYMDVLDQIRTSREQIENKQRQMQVWQVAKQQRFVHVNSIKSSTSSVRVHWSIY